VYSPRILRVFFEDYFDNISNPYLNLAVSLGEVLKALFFGFTIAPNPFPRYWWKNGSSFKVLVIRYQF